MARREPLVDALRAAAILGVLVVNVQAYAGSPWSSPLGAVVPAGAPSAAVAQGIVAWLFQGKAYPLLAFLFGYGQALGARQDAAGAQLRRLRRLSRLLVLGVLHGALLYAGDVLTIYALCGALLWAQSRSATRVLLRRMAIWLAAALVMLGVTWWLAAQSGPGGLESGYAGVRDVGAFVALNAGAYGTGLIGSLLLFGPEVMMLMTAGFVAGRLRLFSHPRWRARLTRAALWLLPLGLVTNAAYAAIVVRAGLHGGPTPLGAIGPLGWCLSAGYAVTLAAWWHAGPPSWLVAMSRLGRYTLSLYVGLSLLCALALSGAGLALRIGTVGLLVASVALWCAALYAAAGATRAGLRGPLEAWMARAR